MNNINTINEVQEAFKNKLEENVYFANHDIPILVENSKQIEYEIKSKMSALGITVTVSTPGLTYRGDSSQIEPFWEITNGNVVVVENPTLNRGRANSATALDTALQVAETLNLISNVSVNSITQTTNSGFVVVNVMFKSNIGFRFEKTTIN